MSAELDAPVFVVDDSKTARDSAVHFLNKLGREAVAFESGQQCLEALEKQRPLFVLLDLHMEPLRGDECCQRIKQEPRWTDVPVIIMTAADQPHEVMYCWRAAADDFLTKPLQTDQLAAKVSALQNATEEKARSAGLDGKTVLLVEDSRFFRNVIKSTLEQAGLRVLVTGGAEEAKRLAERQAEDVDLLLINLILPDGRGVDLARHLRREPMLSGKPLLLMTSQEQMTVELQEEVQRVSGAPLLDKRLLPIEVILSKVFASMRKEVLELRAHERVPFFSVVEFRDEGGRPLSGYSYDISPGGIFVRTLTPAAVRTKVSMKLRIPGHSQHATATGQVAWANPYRRRYSVTAPVGMGVRLIETDDVLRTQIERLAASKKRGTA